MSAEGKSLHQSNIVDEELLEEDALVGNCREIEAVSQSFALFSMRRSIASVLNASRAAAPSRKYANRSSSKLLRPMFTLVSWPQ
jgi:hypothetical protein